MAGAGVTHSELATKLIVEGALAGIAGTVQGQMPMAPVILTALERADMGMPQTGHTMFYPVPPTGVFFDLDGAQCSVWFMGADGDVALSRVDAAMKRAFSKTKQLKDDVDPTDLNQVLWALSTRCHPSEDIDLLRNTLSTGLDPSRFPADTRPYGSKALINACKPHKHLKEFPKRTYLRESTYRKVAARWGDYGFSDSVPVVRRFHQD